MKTKVGWERSGRDWKRWGVIGPHKIVVMNENGEIICWLVCNEWLSEDLSFCISLANLGVINWRWENQLDHIAIKCSKIKIVLRRCKSKERGRYILWPSSTSCKDKCYLALKITETKTKKSNTEKLKDSNVVKEFQLSLQNRFGVLQHLDGNKEEINSTWEQPRDVVI